MQKPRQIIAEYYLHWTTMFEIFVSGSSVRPRQLIVEYVLIALDHHI